MTQSSISRMEEDEKQAIKESRVNDSSSLIGCVSPWAELQVAGDMKKSIIKESGNLLTKEEGDLLTDTQVSRSPIQQTLLSDITQSGPTEPHKNPIKGTPQLTASSHDSHQVV